MSDQQQIEYSLGSFPFNSGIKEVEQSVYMGEGRFFKLIAQHTPELVIGAVYDSNSTDMYSSSNDGSVTMLHHETLFSSISAYRVRLIPISKNKVFVLLTMRSQIHADYDLYYFFVEYDELTNRLVKTDLTLLNTTSIQRDYGINISYKIIQSNLYLFINNTAGNYGNILARINLIEKTHVLLNTTTNHSSLHSNDTPVSKFYHDSEQNKLYFMKRTNSASTATSINFLLTVDLNNNDATTISSHDIHILDSVELKNERIINILASNITSTTLTPSASHLMQFSHHTELNFTTRSDVRFNMSPHIRINNSFTIKTYRLDDFHFIVFITRRDSNRIECRIMKFINEDIVQVSNNSNGNIDGYNLGFYNSAIHNEICTGDNVIRDGENKFYFQNDYNSFIFIKFNV